MPTVFPFRAAQYLNGRGDASSLVSPPYDVLDATSKAALLSKSERNIAAIDLPHTPAKQLGPPSAYAAAGETYRKWLADGTLSRRAVPAMFAYRQTFASGNSRFERCGMACAVEAVPFGPRPGGGVLPHEQTFSGPKEDRLALMRATRAQLSPIFGLHADEEGRASDLVRRVMASRPADQTASTDDGVRHEVWAVDDAATLGAYRDALAGEDIFIADGHHRYTTQLNYLQGVEAAATVPPDHPARRSMMVLIGMSDPGLVIWPTHRVLGGMKGYSIDSFLSALRGVFDVTEAGREPERLEAEMSARAAKAGASANVLGFIDFKTGRCFVATPSKPDPLAARFPGKPREWRDLDVAIIQHAIVEDICQPRLNGGQPVTWAFPHTMKEVMEIGRGVETGAGGGAGFAQLAVIVRPTPLSAVKAISRAGELMPQKSTFFYPKLATGLWVNPLE